MDKRSERLRYFETQVLNVMQTEAGRFVLHELMANNGLMHSGFSSDPLAMAYNNGKRDVAVEVYATIDRVCPEYIPIMNREAKEIDYDHGTSDRSDDYRAAGSPDDDEREYLNGADD